MFNSGVRHLNAADFDAVAEKVGSPDALATQRYSYRYMRTRGNVFDQQSHWETSQLHTGVVHCFLCI